MRFKVSNQSSIEGIENYAQKGFYVVRDYLGQEANELISDKISSSGLARILRGPSPRSKKSGNRGTGTLTRARHPELHALAHVVKDTVQANASITHESLSRWGAGKEVLKSADDNLRGLNLKITIHRYRDGSYLQTHFDKTRLGGVVAFYGIFGEAEYDLHPCSDARSITELRLADDYPRDRVRLGRDDLLVLREWPIDWPSGLNGAQLEPDMQPIWHGINRIDAPDGQRVVAVIGAETILRATAND